ncbi:VanW family protein [Patescibacteria group bacterium]|nr:VanW family protein [Patescibacteria group bacterium]
MAAVSACLLALPYAATKAAGMAITAAGNEYDLTGKQISAWESSAATNFSYVSFAPAQNTDSYVSSSLGLNKEQYTKNYSSKYNLLKIYQFLKNVQQDTDQPAENAVFTENNGIVTDFNPGQNGQALDIPANIDAITTALDNHSAALDLQVTVVKPQVSLSDTNNMGIDQLIAKGDSNFAGSPANRIFNIKIGAQKESGVILAPGETFSFNQYLGPVDGEHGFLPELVIKSDSTIPEFGGGLCQVSTTMFRAAMNAGFPITARRNHSYAVQYYAPQGTDATIYPGVQDLKFVNDSPAHILIWATFPGKNMLRFNIYGSSDNRHISFNGPFVYDRQPDGSMKADWYRTVTFADGKIEKDTFHSDYQSPALFHKVEEYPPSQQPSSTAGVQNQTAVPVTN